MQAVWDRSPASARDVLDAVGAETRWAYTTVKTLLDRLVAKGALSVRMRANTGLYEPLVTREAARHGAVRALLDRAFDGAFAPMLHFVLTDESLSERERAELRAMLARDEEARR